MVSLYIKTNTPTTIPKKEKELSTGVFQAPAFQPRNADIHEVQEPAIVYGPSSSSGISRSKSRSKKSHVQPHSGSHLTSNSFKPVMTKELKQLERTNRKL